MTLRGIPTVAGAALLLLLAGCAPPLASNDRTRAGPGWLRLTADRARWAAGDVAAPDAALPVLVPCPGVVGPSLVFSGLHDGGASVDVYGVDPTGLIVPLTNDGMSSAPHFSPDAESLIFARAATRAGSAGGPPPATALWTMDADGGNQHKLVDMPSVTQPTYSPDGSQIAFTVWLLARIWLQANGFIYLPRTEAIFAGLRPRT